MRKHYLRQDLSSIKTLASTSFKSMWTYRFNAYIGIFYDLLGLAVPLLVWQALYLSNGGKPVEGKSLSDIITYVFIARITTMFVSSNLAIYMHERVRSGNIALDFMRPQSPLISFMSISIGDAFYSIIFRGLPLMVIAPLISSMQAPASALFFVLFIFSILLGFILNTILETLFGMLAFWQLDVDLIGWFTSIFYILLSGTMVPLWFFPDWLRVISQWLPFQAAFFLPIQLYMGQIPIGETINVFFVQLGWIAALMVLQKIVWSRCVRRIVVAGG